MEKKIEKKKKEPVSYDEVFLYLSDKKYSCSDDSRKRAIRSKAAGFITADGVLITREKNSIEPRRWIRDLEIAFWFPSFARNTFTSANHDFPFRKEIPGRNRKIFASQNIPRNNFPSQNFPAGIL